MRNLIAQPSVRVRHRRHWWTGTASVEELQPVLLDRFNFYARCGPRLAGIDPVCVRLRKLPDQHPAAEYDATASGPGCSRPRDEGSKSPYSSIDAHTRQEDTGRTCKHTGGSLPANALPSGLFVEGS